MTPRAGLCGPACKCSMRARSIIASQLRQVSLPMNPLRYFNLFLLRGGDEGTRRKSKAFNTEGTEMNVEETRLQGEILRQSKEFSDCCEGDGSSSVVSISSQSFIISFRCARRSSISAATRIDSCALLKFASSCSYAAISASQRAISS